MEEVEQRLVAGRHPDRLLRHVLRERERLVGDDDPVLHLELLQREARLLSEEVADLDEGLLSVAALVVQRDEELLERVLVDPLLRVLVDADAHLPVTGAERAPARSPSSSAVDGTGMFRMSLFSSPWIVRTEAAPSYSAIVESCQFSELISLSITALKSANVPVPARPTGCFSRRSFGVPLRCSSARVTSRATARLPAARCNVNSSIAAAGRDPGTTAAAYSPRPRSGALARK